MRKRVLIVEDDDALAEGLELNVRLEGYEPLVASSAEDALEILRAHPVDLVLLDVSLPGEDGFSFCRRLRRDAFRAPILFLTARDEEADRVRGLAEGGDDYLVKPFHLAELLARLRAQFRRQAWDRSSEETANRRVRVGDADIDLDALTVRTPRGAHTLGDKEAGILAILLENPSRPVSRRELLDRVWGRERFPTTRTVDNFILRLRRMIEPDAANPVHVLTVHGVGYRLDRGGTLGPS